MFEYLDPIFLIKTLGLVGVIAIVFAESGLLIGFFLPGDSLLFTAGLLASQGYIDIWLLLFGTIFAAILGDNVGYFFGKKVGESLFTREDSFFFKKSYAIKAKDYYDKHGVKTIILARFIPVVRTFAPIIAGVAKMDYKIFLKYNIVGGLLWTISMISLGYILGNVIPNIDRYIFPIIAGIILASITPAIYHLYVERKK
jgi:membrane-associated protein